MNWKFDCYLPEKVTFDYCIIQKIDKNLKELKNIKLKTQEHKEKIEKIRIFNILMKEILRKQYHYNYDSKYINEVNDLTIDGYDFIRRYFNKQHSFRFDLDHDGDRLYYMITTKAQKNGIKTQLFLTKNYMKLDLWQGYAELNKIVEEIIKECE